MEEKPTLQEMLAATIHAFCAQNGFGIPLGYIYCVAHISAEGQQVLTIGEAADQLTPLSLGMAGYLKKNFELDAEQGLTAWAWAGDEDDD